MLFAIKRVANQNVNSLSIQERLPCILSNGKRQNLFLNSYWGAYRNVTIQLLHIGIL